MSLSSIASFLRLSYWKTLGILRSFYLLRASRRRQQSTNDQCLAVPFADHIGDRFLLSLRSLFFPSAPRSLSVYPMVQRPPILSLFSRSAPSSPLLARFLSPAAPSPLLYRSTPTLSFSRPDVRFSPCLGNPLCLSLSPVVLSAFPCFFNGPLCLLASLFLSAATTPPSSSPPALISHPCLPLLLASLFCLLLSVDLLFSTPLQNYFNSHL